MSRLCKSFDLNAVLNVNRQSFWRKTLGHRTDRFVFIQKGFSLVELMIVLAVAAILVSLAIPSFQGLMASARVGGGVNLFVASLDTLRNEAAGKNRVVGMCRSLDPFATTPSCSNLASPRAAAADWGVGWIIYSKPATIEMPSAFNPATDTLIQRVVPSDASSTGVRTTITWNPAIDQFAMGPQGTRLPSSNIEPTVSVDYRLPSAPLNISHAKCINVNLLGRYTVRTPLATGC
jgi:prepilin-type N-terminal cleavage/methylation domain-containing protein